MEVNALTFGFNYDGTPLVFLNMGSPMDVFAIIVAMGYLLANITMMILIARGWLEMQVSKVYHFVWYLNVISFVYFSLSLIRHTPYSNPLLCWFYSVLAEFGLFSLIMGDMDILKSFTADSKYINPKRMKMVQIVFTVFHFVCVGGLYGYGGYVGHAAPPFIIAWNSIGYKIFVLCCLFYETFHGIYISRSVSAQVKRRMELVSCSSETNTKLNKLYYIIVVGLCMTWAGGILWVASAFHGPNSIALESLGNSLGYGHSLFLTTAYKYLRAANQHQKGMGKSTNKKSKENLESSSAVNKSEL